jgi:type I site-specific restriction endonuclease
MTNSLKIEGGEKLGRTIIFAVNQEHAKFILDCFLKRYPEQPVDFIADQMNFIQTIIAHLTKNGTMELSMLFEPLIYRYE